MDANIIARLLEQGQGEREGEGRSHLLIGIGGGSAAGKTTFAERLADGLAPLRVEVVHQDRFFKPVDQLPPYASLSTSRTWPDYNHPDSIKTNELLAYCNGLSDIDVALVEGILVLHYAELRALMDIKCYVDADADERIVRRIRRNLTHYSIDDIADYYLDSVRHQHRRYNAPTKQYADLIVPGGADTTAQRDALLNTLCESIRHHFNS